MLRYLALALFLAVPVAAAEDGIHVNPPYEQSCADESRSWYDSYSYGDENFYHWYYEQGQSSSYGCQDRDDLLDGGVYANGHEVVDVNAGQGGEWGYAQSDGTRQHGYSGNYWNTSFWSGETGYSHAHGTRSEWGTDATASTLLVDATAASRCGSIYNSSTSHRYGESYRSGEYGWASSRSETRGSSDAYSDGCRDGVAVTSGITDVDAARVDGCESSQSSWSHTYEETYNGNTYGWSYAGNEGRSRCASGAALAVGEEQAWAGQTNSCDSYGSGWNGSSYTQEDCERRTGVEGPTGLAVGLGEGSTSSESCQAETCESYAYYYQGIYAEHVYLGEYGLYL